MNLPPESIEAVAAFVRRLRLIQQNYDGYALLANAYDARAFRELNHATLYGLLNVPSLPEDVAFGISLYRDYLASCEHRIRHLVPQKRGPPVWQLGQQTIESLLYEKLGEWLNAMKIICDGSILEADHSRLFVWLDREKHKPRFASGKIERSWMGRCTRTHPSYTSCRLDAEGSQLWIYKQRVMDVTDTYHWYIEHNRQQIAHGQGTKLEWAAEELYRAYFHILTDDLFKEALIPKPGKEVGIYGNWVRQEDAASYTIVHGATTDDRDDLVFVIGYPAFRKDRVIGIIESARKNSERHRDQFNYTITLVDGTVLSGMDWHIYKPEQYVTASVVQCCMCKNVSPKAFDVRYVRGHGPMCGASRDHYTDLGVIFHGADYD